MRTISTTSFSEIGKAGERYQACVRFGIPARDADHLFRFYRERMGLSAEVAHAATLDYLRSNAEQLRARSGLAPYSPDCLLTTKSGLSDTILMSTVAPSAASSSVRITGGPVPLMR